MELGRAAGFKTPATALAAMPDQMPPAVVVERFDIRKDPDDSRMLWRLSSAIDRISAPRAVTLADGADKIVKEVLDT